MMPFEVIGGESKEEIDKQIDDLAKKVFFESIELAGGFRKIVLFRNLTWVPSLIAASYAVILREEFLKSYDEIASFLGLTKQTVKNMLQAKEDKILPYLQGILEKADEHKAGALAKLAYKKLKEEQKLNTIEITEKDANTLKAELPEFAWPIFLMHAIKGLKFPAKKEEILQRLLSLDFTIKGKKLTKIIESCEKDTFQSARDLLKHIAEDLRKER